MYVYMYVRTCVCMYVCMYKYVCMYVCVHTCMYVYTHTHTHIEGDINKRVSTISEALICPVMFSTEILLPCSESLLTHCCLDRNESSRNTYNLLT